MFRRKLGNRQSRLVLAAGARLRSLLASIPALQPEPVSPELVLIDPELARRERARLEEKAYLQSVLDVAALRRAADIPAPPTAETVPRPAPWRDATTFAKRRLLPAALLCSLAANGFLVAHLVARGGGEEAAQLAATLTESAPTVRGSPHPRRKYPWEASALNKGMRGLHGGSTLYHLLKQHRDIPWADGRGFGERKGKGSQG